MRGANYANWRCAERDAKGAAQGGDEAAFDHWIEKYMRKQGKLSAEKRAKHIVMVMHKMKLDCPHNLVTFP